MQRITINKGMHLNLDDEDFLSADDSDYDPENDLEQGDFDSDDDYIDDGSEYDESRRANEASASLIDSVTFSDQSSDAEPETAGESQNAAAATSKTSGDTNNGNDPNDAAAET